MAASQELQVDELLERVLEKSGTLEAFEAERTIEARGRIENLQELVGVAREYRQQTAEPSLAGFLQDISLVSDQDTIRDERGLVTLMTLHNAKGLEFKAVFVIGMEEGVFPHIRAIEEQGIEEERRLFYVGMTRAMERLTLTHTMSRSLCGRRNYNLASRFLDELPRDVERERLRPSSWSSYGSPASAQPQEPRGDAEPRRLDRGHRPPCLARRGHRDRGRAGRRRHRPLRGGRHRAAADDRVRAARADRLGLPGMNLEYRSPTADEFADVLRATYTAFGEELKDDDLERDRALLPVDRVLAAWDGDRPVGVTASWPFELTVPGAPARRGRHRVGVLPSHRRRGILRELMNRQLATSSRAGSRSRSCGRRSR